MSEPVNRCATCKHWDQRTPRSEWAISIRLAEPEGGYDENQWQRDRDAENRYGLCGVIHLLDSYEPVPAEELPLAFCQDGSDYKANLYTQAEFGCALWESSVTPEEPDYA